MATGTEEEISRNEPFEMRFPRLVRFVQEKGHSKQRTSTSPEQGGGKLPGKAKHSRARQNWAGGLKDGR